MKKILFYALLFIAGISTTNAQEIFSKAFKNGTPVHISNNRDKAYAIKAGNTGEDAKSGKAAYTADEIWYLVGNADGFKMYNHALGKKYALKLEGNESGAAAIMANEKDATLLTITAQEDGSYAISPKDAPGESFNMFGGAGRDIKLYSSSDKGGHWNVKTIDMSRSLEIVYNVDSDGALETNYKVGEIAISIDGQQGAIVVDSNNIPESTVCYLPKDAKVGIACKKAYHGWKMNVNGCEEIAEQPLSERACK